MRSDRLTPRKNPVRFLQRLLRPDVVPVAGDGPRIDGQSRIEPLNQPARLVRIVALRDVLLDQWRHASWIKIERDADQSAGRLFWLFFKPSNSAFSIEINHAVLFRLL